MQNLKQVLGNNFDNLYFHAKSKVKIKKMKIKGNTSLKRSGYVESKIQDLEEFVQVIHSCKI